MWKTSLTLLFRVRYASFEIVAGRFVWGIPEFHGGKATRDTRPVWTGATSNIPCQGLVSKLRLHPGTFYDRTCLHAYAAAIGLGN